MGSTSALPEMLFPRTVPVNVTVKFPWPGMSTAILKVTLFPLMVPSVIWTVPSLRPLCRPIFNGA